MQATLGIPWKTAYILMSIALAVTAPLFVVFGALSDRIGRKRIMLVGCLLAAATYLPIYMGMKRLTDAGALATEEPVLLHAVGMVALLALQMVYVCMAYGPIAAFLVELFPTRIRYTSMSLPYHLGNGWFGGFLPLIATALTTSEWARRSFGPGAIYAGLLYPGAVCLVTVVVSTLLVHETKDHRIDAEGHARRPSRATARVGESADPSE
jgi:MFS family permease